MGRLGSDLVLLLMASATIAQTWEEGDNSTIDGCSSHCSLADSDLTCWNKTLEYFVRANVAVTRHLTATLVNIDQWHRRHGSHDGMGKDAVSSFKRSLLVEWRGKGDVLSEDLINSIGKNHLDRLAQVSNERLTNPPHFQCPLPCEYKKDIYFYLFFIMVALLFCVSLSFLIYAFRTSDIKKEMMKGGYSGVAPSSG